MASTLVNKIENHNKSAHVCHGCMSTEGEFQDICKTPSIFEFFREYIIHCGFKLSYKSGVTLCSYCLHILKKFQAFQSQCREISCYLNSYTCSNKGILKYVSINGSRKSTQLAYSGTKHVVDVEPKFTENLVMIPDDIITLNTSMNNCDLTLDEDFMINDTPNTKIDLNDNDHKFENVNHYPHEFDIHDDVEWQDDQNFDDDFEWPEEKNDDLNDNNVVNDESAENKDIVEINKEICVSVTEMDHDYIMKPKGLYINPRKKYTVQELSSLSEDKRLAMEISRLFYNIWQSEENDFYEMFEKIYRQSLVKERDVINELNENVMIWSFLNLNARIADFYNVNIEFVSLEKVREDMDQQRELLKDDKEYCQLCCRRFVHEESLSNHMRMHDSERPYKCEICKYTFGKLPTLLGHLLWMHARIIRCGTCNCSVTDSKLTWVEARYHYHYHRGEVPTCKLCGKTFTDLNNLYLHTKRNHKSEIDAINCLLCGDFFNGPVGMQVHMYKKHRDAVQCEKCQLTFLNKSVLGKHLDAGCDSCKGQSCCAPKHFDPMGSFVQKGCPVCGENFADSEAFDEHYKSVHALRTCPQCGKSIKIGKTFKFHFRACQSKSKWVNNKLETRKEIPNIRIDENKTAKTKDSYENRRFFMCEICGMDRFKRSAQLKLHQMVHTGEKPHECDVCRVRFRTKMQLKVHYMIHTGERPFACTYCPKRFKLKVNLQNHVVFHTNECRYQCHICQKMFKHKETMKEHIRTIHEGLLPKKTLRKLQREQSKADYDHSIEQ